MASRQTAASAPSHLTRLVKLSLGSALAAWIGVKIWPAARRRGRRLHAYLKRKRRLAEYDAMMRITTADAMVIRDAMLKDAQGSLAGDGSCSLPMIPAFVENLPTGKERGDYFALDLGGTNFRVRHVSIDGAALKSTSHEATLNDEVLKASVAGLFDFMVDIAIPFMSKVVDLGSVVPRIGFTFSFPMNQTAIAEGTLLRWTKGYTCPDGVGSDPVKLLKEAFRRKGLSVDVPVLANDTVALLAAGRYQRPDCKMAVILGTGTNAAYMERAEAVASVARNRNNNGSGGGSEGSGTETAEMAINTEWSDLRLPGRVRLLQEDLDMDAASNNPGFQIYEKLISGMHLGDVVRHILVTLAEEGLLWVSATPPEALRSPRRIPTSAISSIDDTAADGAAAKAREVLGGLGLDPDQALTDDELEAIVRVCGMVGRRAARLAATGMLAFARLQGLDTPEAPGFCIAIDGGLYKHYASLRRQIRETFVEVLGEKISSRVDLIMVEDGSGDGAALLAAAATGA